MSINAATLRLMREKGLTLDDVVEIAAAMEARRDPTAAERQRRHREKVAASVTRDVTRDGDPIPPNDIYSNPPSTPVEALASTAPRGRSDRGSKIPEDWSPPPIAELSEEARVMAEKWPAAAYRAEAEAFLNYWLGESSGKARKSNWNRAWCNRIVAVNGKVMREARFAAPANQVGKASHRPMTAAEIRNAIRFAEDHDDPDRAAELKSQLERLTARPPPGPVGDLVGRIGMRVGGSA